MQMSYLGELKKRFNLPILPLPLMEEELKGLQGLSLAVGHLSKLTGPE
jgi:hypothetical protein